MYIMCVSNKNNKNTGSNHILLMITFFFSPFVNELPGVLVDLNCFREENSSYFA